MPKKRDKQAARGATGASDSLFGPEGVGLVPYGRGWAVPARFTWECDLWDTGSVKPAVAFDKFEGLDRVEASMGIRVLGDGTVEHIPARPFVWSWRNNARPGDWTPEEHRAVKGGGPAGERVLRKRRQEARALHENALVLKYRIELDIEVRAGRAWCVGMTITADSPETYLSRSGLREIPLVDMIDAAIEDNAVKVALMPDGKTCGLVPLAEGEKPARGRLQSSSPNVGRRRLSDDFLAGIVAQRNDYIAEHGTNRGALDAIAQGAHSVSKWTVAHWLKEARDRGLSHPLGDSEDEGTDDSEEGD